MGMAFTIQQLEAIDAAIGTGELTVTYDGKSVTYRSITELIRARNRIQAELSASGQLPRRIRTAHFSVVRD